MGIMKDRKTLKEIFAEAQRKRHDSFGIANDPEALEGLKNVVEKHGDVKAAEEIQKQIDKLRRHTREEILAILDEEHIYYSANRLSVTALYDWGDVKKSLDDMLDGKEKRKTPACSWAVCRETDPIEEIELYEADKPFTLHIPIDSFDTAEEAVDRFLELYKLEEKGVDTSLRCRHCKHLYEDGICGPHKGIKGADSLVCIDYKQREEE